MDNYSGILEPSKAKRLRMYPDFAQYSYLTLREMIASLKICAAVHGTVDDNMAVRGKGDESGGEQDGERG